MIVVVGQLLYRAADDGASAEGLAALIGLAAAGAGRAVQLVGKTGEDPEGEAVLLALARGGVGHVAVLRDAGMTTPLATGTIVGDFDPIAGDDQAPAAAPMDAAVAGLDATANAPSGLDAADVELALRYLSNFAVVVLADSATDEIAQVIASAASWAEAHLIAVVPAGAAIPKGLPPEAIVFEAPDGDADGVFAAMVGSFAAALDNGGDPAAAFKATMEEAGWTPTPAE